MRTQVTPPDARYNITIDGQTLPNEARTIAFRLNPGTHTVVVAAPGYLTSHVEVTLVERQAAVVDVNLQSAAPAKPTTPPSTNSGKPAAPR